MIYIQAWSVFCLRRMTNNGNLRTTYAAAVTTENDADAVSNEGGGGDVTRGEAGKGGAGSGAGGAGSGAGATVESTNSAGVATGSSESSE